MRRLAITPFLAAGLYITTGSLAFAADMAIKAPPTPPAVTPWSWTGPYAGVNIGYSWADPTVNVQFYNATTGALFYSTGASAHVDGVIGGGQVGYNWQTGKWVTGLEADIQGSGERGTATVTCPAGICAPAALTATITEKLDWFGTVRARLGYTVTPTSLLYITGGLAYGGLNESGAVADPTALSFSKTSAGWTVGAGYEGRLSGNWTWKVEYLLMGLQGPSGTVTAPVAGTCTINGVAGFPCPPNNVHVDPLFQDNIIRVGVNYKWP